MNKKRQAEAAARLEELTVMCEKATKLLNEGVSDFQAYTLLYLVRRELGYVVRNMGITGVPFQEETTWAKKQLGL